MTVVPGETLVSGQYGSFVQIRKRGNAATVAIPPTPGATCRHEHLSQRREVCCAGQHVLALAQSDERSPEWDTTNKRFRAVDRVEHPTPVRIRTRDPKLFTEDPVARKVAFDPCTGCLLGASVRDRHGGAVRLGFDGERGLVVAHGDFTRDASHLFDGSRERLRRLTHESNRTGSPPLASSSLISRTVV